MTRAQRQRILERDNYRCWYCGADLRLCPPRVVNVDHQVPKCQDGPDDPANVVACCYRCNQSKNRRTVAQWRAALRGQLNHWLAGMAWATGGAVKMCPDELEPFFWQNDIVFWSERPDYAPGFVVAQGQSFVILRFLEP